MKKIASFTIDHIRLLPGIYVSRKDNVKETCDIIVCCADDRYAGRMRRIKSGE